jgi:hypothetical protein
MDDSGEVVVVGKSYYIALYKFENSSWVLKNTLNKTTDGGDFGQSCMSVSGDGNKVLVGASSYNSNTGKWYVYNISGNTFSEEHNATGSGTNVYASQKGYMNHDGTRYIVKYSGSSTRVYEYSTGWGLQTTINKTGELHGDKYASRIVIGEYSINTVTVYTIETDGSYSVEETFTGTSGQNYGMDVKLNDDGNLLFIGINNDDKVEIWSRAGTTWSLSKTIQGTIGEDFGNNLTVNSVGDVLGVSSPTFNTNDGQVSIYSSAFIQPTLASTGTLAFHYGDFDNVYGDLTVSNAAANGHVYADTPTGEYSWGTLGSVSNTATGTTYTWTPSVGEVTSDVLMVAGGGAGGTDFAGGGGAGGLVFSQSEKIVGRQTIIVGNGGVKGTVNEQVGANGTDTIAFGYTAAGGGGGGSNVINTGNQGSSGGSGGGGGSIGGNVSGGTSTQNTYNGKGFGNAGGSSASSAGGGGGGAMEPGFNASSGNGGNGGVGKDLSSTFGTTYGDNGYFAGGGGGGEDNRSSGNVGQGGQGGGGRGGNNSLGTVNTLINPLPGTPHTGGGGGGTGTDPTDSVYYGQAGGSGIVLVSNVPGAKFSTPTTPSLTYDGYNKLTVVGVNDQTLYKDSNSWSLGTASSVYVADPGEYTYFTRDAATAFLANVVVESVTEAPKEITWVDTGDTEVKIQASDKQGSDLFGYSVAIDGDYAIVGSRNEDTGAADAGAAYIFKRDGTSWSEQAKIQASDKQGSDMFGHSVAISGDYAIVGALYEDTTDAGAAYIFKRDGTSWTEQAKIQASDKQAYDLFGNSVSISEDYAIVGAPYEDSSATDAGAAYIFKRDGTSWTEQTKIQASDPGANVLFGHSVAISGDYAIVGAHQEDAGAADAGAAYIFKRDGTSWTEQAKIQASDKQMGDQFGYSVAISGDYAIVGSQQEDAGGTNAGAAYIFKRDGTSWTEQTKIQASDPGVDDRFGYSVAISGDYAIVGAHQEDTGAADAGAAYIFKRDGTSWTEQAKIQASDKAGSDQFGFSVAISGDYTVVGALYEDTGDTNAGGAYIYSAADITPTPPSLTYDGITNLKITGAEASSTITYKSATNDKRLACGTDLTTYPLYRAGGNYKAEVSGPTTFTFTSNVTVPEGELLPLYKYPPDGATTSSLTYGTNADSVAEWTLSGADYGNGEYFAVANVTSVTNKSAYHAFDSNLTAGFENTTATTGTLRLQLPSAETIHKYVVWPKAADGKRPKSWTIEGSQDAVTWTTIHTVTDSPPSLTGDAHEITSPAAYVYYRINVTANNGGTGLEIAELSLYGDVAFSITFSDGWVTTNGANTIPIGSTYTLPTYTSSLPVTVTGDTTIDTGTVGTYRVVYTSIGIDELARRVVRRFVVEYPTIAFHYGGFVATDYGGIYDTKEDAAADGFFYADTVDFINDPTYGSLTVVSNTTSNTEYTWTPYTAMTADVLMVAGGGGGGGNMGGGGGAGGLKFYQSELLSDQKTIVVGNGGIGIQANDEADTTNSGYNTSAFGYTVTGGGRGGGFGNNIASEQTGADGGSGGGGGWGEAGGSGTNGEGFDGGQSSGNNDGGGGGGAGGPGVAGTSTSGGNGGLGINYTDYFGQLYGESGWFASGGGGGKRSTTEGMAGVSPPGGGSDGSNSNSKSASDAQNHTGGGGGGPGDISAEYKGGNGGSGIVIVKQTSFLLVATFSDEWTSGTTTVTPGSTFNLPTVTNITGVTVTGSVDSATEGTYDVTWSKVVDGFLRSITRRFVVVVYETLTFTTEGTGTLSITGNGTDTVTMYKLTGGDAWNAGAIETTGFTPPVTVEFDKTAPATENINAKSALSLDADNTNQSGNWTNLDWAAYPGGTVSLWEVLHNGSFAQSSSVSWSNTDKKYLVYNTDGSIKHYSGSTLMYSNAGAGTGTRYLRTAFRAENSGNGAFSNIRVRKQIWNGSEYV